MIMNVNNASDKTVSKCEKKTSDENSIQKIKSPYNDAFRIIGCFESCHNNNRFERFHPLE